MIQPPDLTPIVIGTSRDYRLRVPKADGGMYSPADSPFDGTETLSATLGLGVDQPTLFTPAVAWIDAGVARFQVTFNDPDLRGLVAGDYLLQVRADKGGRTASIFVGYLPVRQTSGTAAAPPVYCSLDDMRLYFPPIDELEHPSKRAQFVRERGRARTWFDLLLQRHWRASGYGISTLGFPIGGIGPFRTGGVNKWLQDQLDADLLMVTDDIREALAKKSLAFALESQVGGRDEKTSYQALAAAYHGECDFYLVPMITAGLDFDGDGWPDLVIDLATTDALWA